MIKKYIIRKKQNMKLRQEFLNIEIYNPFGRKKQIGKFINPELYPYLQKLFPEYFEKETIKNNIKENAIRFNDTKHNPDDNNGAEPQIAGE
jgi:hypothetical protein